MLLKNKTKNIVFLVLSLVLVFCSCMAIACSKPKEKIELLDEIDRPSAIVSREFDAMSIVANTNGYDLILEECFYLSDSFERVDIDVNGTKFTPPAEKEVFITLKIKGGKTIKEAIIKVEAPVSAIQDHFLSSWNDEGVGKVVTADQRFLTNGAESAIKVSYMGSLGSPISGPGIGGFYYTDKSTLPFSVTDWKNAVLVMDIFNPTNENLVIYYCIIKDRGTWTSPVTGAYGQQRFALLPAGQWTKATLSLNMLGIDYNIYEKYTGNMHIGFRAAHETMPATKPYEWTMYIANMDITDYSKERFPDLQTMRPDQILEAMDGDKNDKDTYVHLLEENNDVRYVGVKTKGEIVAYSTLDGVQAPSSESGDYLNKYTITANPSDNDSRGKLVCSTPLYFKNEGYFAFNDEQKELDFSIAEVSFDFYNPNDFGLDIYLVPTLSMYMSLSQYKVTAKANDWTNVKFSLNSINIGDSYNFAISLGEMRTQYETLNYYIDNFKIEEGEPIPVIQHAKLSEVETALTSGTYNFNETNNQIDEKGIAWIEVDGKDEKLESGKNYLQVKVNFTEFGTDPAYCYEAGIKTYKFSWGYRHGSATIFSWNDYSGGAIIGTTPSALATGLKVYQGDLCVISHERYNGHDTPYAWSYYSTANNYGIANGKLSTGVDYVFEYDLAQCTGNLELNFGNSAIIKEVKWVEESGVQGGTGDTEEPGTTAFDANDVNALPHLYTSGTPAFGRGLYNTSAEVIAYEDSALTKPEGVEGNTLVKYTLTSIDTHASGKLINSIPLRYESGGAYKFNEEEASIDFTKAVLSFYIYSPVAVQAILTHTPNAYFNTSNKAIVNVPAGQWTKVEFSLNNYFTINASADYLFAVGLFAERMQYDEINYYIDNVTIYEAFVPDAEDTKALVHLHAVGSNMWPGCNTTGEIIEYATLNGISKPDGVNGDSLIKYTFTSAGNWVNSLPLRYANATHAFNEEESKLDFSKAYISFYVYNPNDVDFTAYLARSANGYFHTTNKVDSVAVKKGEWTKVEFSLASLNIDATGSYDVAIFMGASITEGAGATYYIDNVTIYEKA